MKEGTAKLRIVVRCPETQRLITNLILSRIALEQLAELSEVWCPYCGTSHLWDREEADLADKPAGK